MHETTRKVYKDNTFTLLGTLFEVPLPLAGFKIRLLYDPHIPVLVPRVFYEGKYQDNARPVDSYSNTKVKRSVINRGSVQQKADNHKSNLQTTGGFTNTKASLAASKIQLKEASDE